MRDKVLAIVAQETGADPETLQDGTEIDSLGMDSLEFIHLMLEIRDQLADIPDSALPAIVTVGDLVRAVEARV
jgi:acyl carrier protein